MRTRSVPFGCKARLPAFILGVQGAHAAFFEIQRRSVLFWYAPLCRGNPQPYSSYPGKTHVSHLSSSLAVCGSSRLPLPPLLLKPAVGDNGLRAPSPWEEQTEGDDGLTERCSWKCP